MEEKKVKQILVYTDFTNQSEAAIKHAIIVTKIFDAELNLLHVIDENTKRFFKTGQTEKQAAGKLEAIKETLSGESDIVIRTHLQEGCNCTIINSLAESLGAVIILMAFHSSNELQYLTVSNSLKIIRKSRIPYLLLNHDLNELNSFKNVVIPINHLKECKETVPWAAYFGKLNGSEIHLLVPKNPDALTKNNLFFARKLYKQYELSFKEIQTDKSIFSITRHSYEYANNIENSFIIIMNTKRYSLFDYIFGPTEKRIISNKYKIPVLSLNPRSDLFIPCV